MLINHFKENLRAIYPEFIIGFINGDLLILMPYYPDLEKRKPDVYQQEIVDYLKTCFYDVRFQVQVYISRIVPNLQSLAAEYRKIKEKNVFQNNSEMVVSKNIISELYTRILSLCEKIVSGDTKSSVNELYSVKDCIRSKINGNMDEEIKYLKDICTILKGFIFSDKNAYISLNDFFSNLQIRIEKEENTEQLFDEILNMVTSCAEYYEKKILSNVDSKIDTIIEYINKNYTIDNSLESLAKQYNLNTSYLSKTFKQRYGKNFIDFVTELRIEQAKKLLETTNKSVKEITYEVGYNSQTYFCKVFKKVVGISASEYKQK
jgi:two-component system response regulator YesN